MKKIQFWKADWFVGLLVVLLFLFSANGDLMQSLERKAYDLGVRASSHTPSDKIAVIAIDDQSIANLGRWPWPRTRALALAARCGFNHPPTHRNGRRTWQTADDRRRR